MQGRSVGLHDLHVEVLGLELMVSSSMSLLGVVVEDTVLVPLLEPIEVPQASPVGGEA